MTARDQLSYVCMIQTLVRSTNFEDVVEAELIMLEGYEMSCLELDTLLCCNLLSGFGRCGNALAADTARNLLPWMKPKVNLDTVCYNAVLSAHKRQDPEKAWEFFQSIPTEPTSVTFSILLDIYRDHDECTMRTFEECVGRGMTD